MDNFGPVGLALIVTNILISLKGFNDNHFFNSLLFQPDAILKHKDYKRLFTSGFLHVSPAHLIFNMLTLYFFAGSIEKMWGSLAFAVLYFASLLGGNLLALLIHRNNSFYRAVGASGAVSGVLFAFIAMFPNQSLYFFFIPIPIPAWIVGFGFIVYSIYGIRAQKDNIGHEAHLGGAVLGLLFTLLYYPYVLETNLWTIVLILIPVIIFIFILLFKPELIIPSTVVDRWIYPSKETIDDRYNSERANRQKELDALLDKIRKSGVESLTEYEKKRLEELSD